MYDLCKPLGVIRMTFHAERVVGCEDERVEEDSRQARGVHEDVLERLGPDLLWGELSATRDLRLELIEARYGVSRSAAREVVRVLEAMRVVTSRRRVGITVRPR